MFFTFFDCLFLFIFLKGHLPYGNIFTPPHMVNIQEIKIPSLSTKIAYHEKIGGALRICVFEIKENHEGRMPAEYDAHLVTARQTLEIQHFHVNFIWNKVGLKDQRKSMPHVHTDLAKLDPSGRKIDLAHFLGPHFNLKTQKPLVRGGVLDSNAYFYYDQQETMENKVDIYKLEAEYRDKYPENKGNFIHAFMEPPYNLNLEKEIFKRGEYLLAFLDYFFDDINLLTVYAWDTDCSPIFDSGKEWWGSYFWTIYNPTKKWYIGIVASETD